MGNALGVAVDILLWLLLGLGILFVMSVWTAILAVVWTSAARFVSEYKKAGEELAKVEAEEDKPDLMF